MSPWRLELHPSLPSTQDIAIARAREGAPAGLAVQALIQTSGRGQFGRVWQAPEGNLNLSLLLRPNTPPQQSPQWSLAIGVAAAEVLSPQVRLKFPNDLMLERRKLGGILIDSEASSGKLDWLVVGIGINIAGAPETDQPTIALGRPLAVEDLLSRIGHWCAIIETQGFAPVRAAWRAVALDPAGAEPHLVQWES